MVVHKSYAQRFFVFLRRIADQSATWQPGAFTGHTASLPAKAPACQSACQPVALIPWRKGSRDRPGVSADVFGLGPLLSGWEGTAVVAMTIGVWMPKSMPQARRSVEQADEYCRSVRSFLIAVLAGTLVLHCCHGWSVLSTTPRWLSFRFAWLPLEALEGEARVGSIKDKIS